MSCKCLIPSDLRKISKNIMKNNTCHPCHFIAMVEKNVNEDYDKKKKPQFFPRNLLLFGFVVCSCCHYSAFIFIYSVVQVKMLFIFEVVNCKTWKYRVYPCVYNKTEYYINSWTFSWIRTCSITSFFHTFSATKIEILQLILS